MQLFEDILGYFHILLDIELYFISILFLVARADKAAWSCTLAHIEKLAHLLPELVFDLGELLLGMVLQPACLHRFSDSKLFEHIDLLLDLFWELVDDHASNFGLNGNSVVVEVLNVNDNVGFEVIHFGENYFCHEEV